MSGGTGRSFKMAFSKFGTNSWGVPASVTNGVYFESDAGMQLKVGQVTDNAFGQAFLSPADPGLVEAPNLSLAGRDRYEDFQYVLEALAMGSPTAVTISTSATGQVTSWQHVFDLADAIDGLGATFAIDKQLYVDELTSAKITGFSLTQGSMGEMTQTFTVIGSRPTNLSSVNVAATVAGATFPALSNRIIQQQGVLRINTASAGALGSTNAVAAESIKMTFSRTEDAPHIYGQNYIAEPADQGFPAITLEVTYPRMNTVSANSLYTALQSSTGFKADWIFTGPLINSTDAWTKKYQFPYLQLDVDGFKADTVGANQVKPMAKFQARLSASSPTGMPFVRPFRLTRIMTNSVVAF